MNEAIPEKGLAVLIFAGAVALGIYQALKAARLMTVAITAVSILGVSNLLASWPWFVADQPRTWLRTYFYALAFTGVASFIVHVVPFCLAYYFANRFKVARSRHAA